MSHHLLGLLLIGVVIGVVGAAIADYVLNRISLRVPHWRENPPSSDHPPVTVSLSLDSSKFVESMERAREAADRLVWRDDDKDVEPDEGCDDGADDDRPSLVETTALCDAEPTYLHGDGKWVDCGQHPCLTCDPRRSVIAKILSDPRLVPDPDPALLGMAFEPLTAPGLDVGDRVKVGDRMCVVAKRTDHTDPWELEVRFELSLPFGAFEATDNHQSAYDDERTDRDEGDRS